MTELSDPLLSGAWEQFRKSSYSGAAGCVEVSFSTAGEVLLRDSKTPDGPRLYFTRTEWLAFLAGVRGGQFEPPGTS